MNITVSNADKIRIFSYNTYTLFRKKAAIKNEQDRIDIFDQKWVSGGLLALLKNAIDNNRLLNPNLVRDRLKEVSWHNAISYVKDEQVHYEFRYEGLLCIAQLKKIENSDDLQLTDIWGLRYSNVPPEVICIDLGSVEEKNLLEQIAGKFGKTAEELARDAILEKVHNIIRNLERQNQSLQVEIETLKEQRRQINIDFYKEAITQFRERLEKNYPETAGQESWQSWIYNNNWLFGIQYGQPIEKQKVGFDTIPDFLFPTIDGFIDILEIKRPSHKVISEDPSHRGSFTWSSEATKAIGQVVNYLHEIEINQLQISQKLNRKYTSGLNTPVSLIKPRGFILIGRSNDWNEYKREAFRKLNHALHGIELLTYDDLISRGRSLIDLYIQEIK
jgi:hypothetical protein